MKKHLTFGMALVVIAVIFSGCETTYQATQSYTTSSPVTYQAFYDDLSPYGTWIDYPGYGNVWNPRLGAGFRPYATNGHWIYSNDGWAWQSNYNWGWAPFHYGRWLYDDNYGWLWMPGYDWSPAWVTWGTSDNYYAWAPLMPDVNVGQQYGGWRPHAYYWNVCDRNRIYDRNISNVVVRNERNKNITNNITIINNYNTSRGNNYYAKGPEVNEVERYTNQKIDRVTFRDVNQVKQIRQQGNVMNVYRPVVQNPGNTDFKRPDAPGQQNNGNINKPVAPGNQTNNITRPPNQNEQPVKPQKPALNPGNNVNQTPPVRQPNNTNYAPVQNQPANVPQKPVRNPVNPANNNNNSLPVREPNKINNTPPVNYQTPAVPQRPVQNPVKPVVTNPQPARIDTRQNQQPQNQNPQPREFRRPAPSQVKPIETPNQQPAIQRNNIQRRNVEQLPKQKAPVNNINPAANKQ